MPQHVNDAPGALSPRVQGTALVRTDARAQVPAIAPLFRQEAIEAHRSQWLGTVVLTAPVSSRVFGGFALALLVLIVAFLAFGEFTRRAKVTGWLVPDSGLIRVYAPVSGVVSAVRVEEGQSVRRGDPLVVLGSERRSTLGDANLETTRRIEERIRLLGGQREQQEGIFERQQQALRQRIRALREENRQIDEEIRLQRERVRLLEESVQRLVTLEKSGYASPQMTLSQRDTLLDNVAKVRSMERTRIANGREIASAETELASLPLNRANEASRLEREVSELEQQRVVSESVREVVLTAPQDGVVTAVQADVGGTAGTSTPVVTILPGRAKLQAQLFSPSRSVGFVAPGQRVTIRYPAYPYQKFGHQRGTVRSISRNAMAPSDLPAQLSGLAPVLGAAEPVYRITVALDSQVIDAGAKEHRLMPGMLLDADIELERRTIFEWMIEPILTLTERR